MHIFDKLVLLSQPLSNLVFPKPAADTCNLLRSLPEPLRSLQGSCVSVSDCTGYASPGFCHGASDIQVSDSLPICCTSTFAGDNGPSSKQLSDFGLSLIQAFEGFVNTFYCDRAASTTQGHRHCLPEEGKLTIGWGHLCDPESSCDWIKDTDLPISQSFGDDLLRSDMKRYVDAVNDKITVDLTQNQFDALVSFIFNCGPDWLQSVAPKINSGDLTGATDRMKQCNTAGGVPNSNLKMRRGIEVNIFNSPNNDASIFEL